MLPKISRRSFFSFGRFWSVRQSFLCLFANIKDAYDYDVISWYDVTRSRRSNDNIGSQKIAPLYIYMQNCVMAIRKDTRDVEGSTSEATCVTILPEADEITKQDRWKCPGIGRIFEFHPGAGRDIRHQRQGWSVDNEIPERRLFPAANCSGRLQDIHRRRR